MIYYLLFSLVCLILFIYDNWYDGVDLTCTVFASMVIMAVFPIMNILMLGSVLFNIAGRLLESAKGSKILLKGRNEQSH